jgi:hypothetical protein
MQLPAGSAAQRPGGEALHVVALQRQNRATQGTAITITPAAER